MNEWYSLLSQSWSDIQHARQTMHQYLNNWNNWTWCEGGQIWVRSKVEVHLTTIIVQYWAEKWSAHSQIPLAFSVLVFIFIQPMAGAKGGLNIWRAWSHPAFPHLPTLSPPPTSPSPFLPPLHPSSLPPPPRTPTFLYPASVPHPVPNSILNPPPTPEGPETEPLAKKSLTLFFVPAICKSVHSGIFVLAKCSL
jgi:hypothetical protein